MAQIAAMEPGELLALVRHLRPRLVPGEEPPAPEVAERIVQMDAAALRELGRRLQAAGVPRVVAIFGVQGWRWAWAVRELVFALDADAARGL